MRLPSFLVIGLGALFVATPALADVCMQTTPEVRPSGQPVNTNGLCWLDEVLGDHFGVDGFYISDVSLGVTSDTRPLARRIYYLRKSRANLESELGRDGKNFEKVLAEIADGLPEAMCGPFKEGQPEGEVASFVRAGGVVDYYLRVQNSPKVKTVRIDTCEAL